VTAKIRVKKPAAPLERVEQALLVQRIRRDPRCRDLLWTATANGMAARSKVTAAKMIGQGLNRGVPDLLFFEPVGVTPQTRGILAPHAVGLAIEMKRHPNKPTPEQRDWLSGLQARGWVCHVAYSAEEAWTYITDYFGWQTP
jgi:hypothetical protein